MLLGSLACRDGKRYHGQSAGAAGGAVVRESVTGGTGTRGLAAIREFQQALDEEFRDPESSPLPAERIPTFPGIEFFEPDTAFQVMARLVRTPEALPFEMPTTTDRIARERQYGTLYFELQGRPFALEVYQSPDLMMQEGYEDYLFLPFTDATNGRETYAGGRYMDLRIPPGDSLLLDFNKAYNPSCAYNPRYSCPIVPPVNHLDLPVTVGVKAYRK